MLPLFDMKNCLTDDNDDYGQYVSDLSEDDDVNPDCSGYSESMTRTTSCNAAALKCFHPSMVPGGVKVAMSEKQQVLVLTNVASMRNLTAGSERDDTPRILSKAEISSVATSALRKHRKATNDATSNASWNHLLKPAGKSSNLLMSRIQSCSWLSEKSSMKLDPNPFLKTTAEGPSRLKNLRTVLRRRPLSRSDLRSASSPALQYGITMNTDEWAVSCIKLSNHQPTSEATKLFHLHCLAESTSNDVTLTH